MKDEERAEEYVKSVIDVNGFDWKIVREICLAYLAGLKAGRSQWHDLEKDPNDLPENKRNVWCDYDDGYGKGFYNKDEGGWWIEDHMFCSAINAWCELPTFDKE